MAVSHRHPRTLINLLSFFLIFGVIWPGSREKMLSLVVVYPDGSLIREFNKGNIRALPLGRDDSPRELMGELSGICFTDI